MTSVPDQGDPATLPPRERILLAASELFYLQGIRSVGVDVVVERSGVAKATLYKHFPSKDGLVAEVLRRRDTAWRAWFEEAVLDATADPAGRLLAVFDVLGGWFAGDEFRGSPFINVRIELASDEHPAVEVAADHVARVRRFLAVLAADCGAPDPPRLAVAVQQVMKGAMVMAMEHEPLAAEIGRETTRCLLVAAGLLPPEGPAGAR
jgi:AcrR family transcriptional regulator